MTLFPCAYVDMLILRSIYGGTGIVGQRLNSWSRTADVIHASTSWRVHPMSLGSRAGVPTGHPSAIPWRR
jgi:hypothetical protein